MAQSLTSKPVDPFEGNSILSLHPRTFRDSKVSVKSNDLEAIHQHMSSMALENPDKHFEEAKAIIDGGSKYLNTKENYEHSKKENEDPQKNRPSLARKRAKFSMKPDTSQPSTIIEPTFQMDKLQDPDKFFAAFEKFENTVKELKRQKGEDPNELKIPTAARQRRPELPRRKVSYQHHVYSSQPENDTSYSQEALEDTIISQPVHDFEHESATPNCQSKEKEVAGSVAKAEERVNKLFDDLMSSNIADLDGNEALSYLKDRLKIKPVAINDLQLPNFHDIPTVNLSTSVNLIKDQNTLPDTHALSDKLIENTPGELKKLFDKTSRRLSSTATPPKSPFLAISTFGKLMSKSIAIESDDPFSAHDADLFPTTTTHAIKDKEIPVSASKEDHDQFHNMEEMDEDVQGYFTMPACNTTDFNNMQADEMVEKAASSAQLNLNVEDITDNLHCEQDIGENVVDATAKVVTSASPEESFEITTIKESERNCFHSDDSSLDVPDASRPVQNPGITPEQQNEEHLKTSVNNRMKTRARKVDQKKKRLSLADDSSINVPDASLPVQNPDLIPEQQNEEHLKTTMNNKRKTRASKIDQKKKRHSLAGGGSCWTAGVRRSNRIKSKPLEYWKGERLLYARVHNSLPTVIGVKYISSADTGGKAGFKVESFVADEYKDLVELTSLH